MPSPFALDLAVFEKETERGLLRRPELAVARTRLLDYFRGTRVQVLAAARYPSLPPLPSIFQADIASSRYRLL